MQYYFIQIAVNISVLIILHISTLKSISGYIRKISLIRFQIIIALKCATVHMYNYNFKKSFILYGIKVSKSVALHKRLNMTNFTQTNFTVYRVGPYIDEPFTVFCRRSVTLILNLLRMEKH